MQEFADPSQRQEELEGHRPGSWQHAWEEAIDSRKNRKTSRSIELE